MGRTHSNAPRSVRLAKIAAPRHGGILPRERLYAMLDRHRERSATWTVGPPGAGKTTLVAGYLAARGIPCLWYQIDEGDADPATFFHYLSMAAEQAVPGTPARLPRFAPDALPGLRSFAREFFRQLFAAVRRAVIVLDNYQEAPESCLLHEIVRTACEETPPATHIVIVSRGDPPPAFARLHASDALARMRWEDLQLTVEEVEGFARLHGLALTPDSAQTWHRRSAGWAAGLRLLIEDQGGSAVPSASPPGLALFDYFAEEVYRKLPDSTRRLLMSTSVAPAVSPAVAEALSGQPDASGALERLAHSGYFTVRHGNAPCHYQYHPLFRDFLLRQAAATLGPATLAQLKKQAATLLAREDRPEDAAVLLIELEAWPDLRDLILAQAMRLIEQGRHMTLESWLRKLPDIERRSDPWLDYWLGACLLLHDPAASLQCFTRAYERFRGADGAAEGLLLAWSGAVDAIFHEYDDLAQMDRWLAEFDRRLRPLYDRAPAMAKARVSFSMFVALSFRQPERDEIEEWAERVVALERNTEQPALRALIRLHVCIDRLWRGQLVDAVGLFESLRMRSVAEAPASPLAPMVECLVDAIISLHLGESARCVTAVERGLAIARESGLHFWDSTLLWLAACTAVNNEDYAAAVGVRAALDATADLRRTADAAYHHALSARLAALHGSHAEGLRDAVAAVENIKRLGCPFFTGAWLIGMSCAAERCKDAALAGAFLDEGLSIAQRLNNDLLSAVGLLVRAAREFAAGRSESALGDLRDGMGLCARHGYAGFYFWPRDRIALLCLRALEHGIEPSYAADLIRKGSLDPPEEAMASEAWPWPVKVFTLGRFAILRDGEALKFSGKTQRAPLNLLKALIAFGGVEVPESKLSDALWSDSEGDSGGQALATTLFRLRKLVGADTVRRHDGKLSLDRTQCWVDRWSLERALAAPGGADAGALRRRLADLYRGPFLAGEQDAPWALSLRERLHLQVVGKLCDGGQEAEHAAMLDEAFAYYRFGLEVDDLVEEFHRGVMRCHIADGQPADMVNAYRRCQKTLATRLGVEPSHATTQLYLAALK